MSYLSSVLAWFSERLAVLNGAGISFCELSQALDMWDERHAVMAACNDHRIERLGPPVVLLSTRHLLAEGQFPALAVFKPLNKLDSRIVLHELLIAPAVDQALDVPLNDLVRSKRRIDSVSLDGNSTPLFRDRLLRELHGFRHNVGFKSWIDGRVREAVLVASWCRCWKRLGNFSWLVWLALCHGVEIGDLLHCSFYIWQPGDGVTFEYRID